MDTGAFTFSFCRGSCILSLVTGLLKMNYCDLFKAFSKFKSGWVDDLKFDNSIGLKILRYIIVRPLEGESAP